MIDEEVHRTCVGPSWMRQAYNRSNDYCVCNEDGSPNPKGKHYKSIARGWVKPIKGQCSFEFLPNGDPDPKWSGCPTLQDIPTEEDKLNELIRRAR